MAVHSTSQFYCKTAKESTDIKACLLIHHERGYNECSGYGTPSEDSDQFANHITKTRLSKYIENFTTKNGKFSDKNSDIVHISAQNIDCGYSLEPPRRGGSYEYLQSMCFSKIRKIMYTPVNPRLTI